MWVALPNGSKIVSSSMEIPGSAYTRCDGDAQVLCEGPGPVAHPAGLAAEWRRPARQFRQRPQTM